MTTYETILILLAVISFFIISRWVDRRFLNKYTKAIRTLLIAALFAILFRKQIIDDVVHRKYMWLIIITFFFASFIYTFFKDILKKEEPK